MDEPIFCICRQPDDGSIMIQCNYCDEWYHIECVRIPPADLDSLKQYQCEACVSGAPASHSRTAAAAGQRAEGDGERERPRSGQQKRRPRAAPKPESEDELYENLPTNGGPPRPQPRKRSVPEPRAAVTAPKPPTKTARARPSSPATSTISTPPPPQFPTYRDETDPIRQTVIDGLNSVLLPYWSTADPGGSADADGMAGVATAHPDSLSLAVQIEAAMFAVVAEERPEICGGSHPTRCGTKYKAKFRTVQFNLKDPKNSPLRRALASGRISPEKLVSMSPQEMANDEVAEVIRAVRERSIAQSMIAESSVELGFVKKTHKGEEALPIAAAGSPDQDSHSEYHHSPAHQQAVLAKSSTGWRGKVILPEVARFSATATFLSSTATPKLSPRFIRLLPHNMHISGRVSVATASNYVKQVWSGSSSRDVLFFPISPDDDTDPNSSTSQFTLVSYLLEQNRWAVVAHDPTRGIRDFYLAPAASAAEDLNVFPDGSMAGLDAHATLPLLIGVLVLGKDSGGHGHGRSSDGWLPLHSVASVDPYDPEYSTK